MNARRLRTLVRREVKATLRDPFTLGVLIAVPLVALVAFGFILSTKVEHMEIGVHDASRSAASRRLVAELAASEAFRPQEFPSVESIERALVAGEIGAGLVIPGDFERDLLRAMLALGFAAAQGEFAAMAAQIAAIQKLRRK